MIIEFNWDRVKTVADELAKNVEFGKIEIVLHIQNGNINHSVIKTQEIHVK